jgi:hypothetical protein
MVRPPRGGSPVSRFAQRNREASGRATAAGRLSLWVAGLPMELLACEHRSSLKKRRPDGESGRAGSVIDEFANESFDLRTFENEDHGLIRQKHAVALEARQSEPVGGAPSDYLGCPLA